MKRWIIAHLRCPQCLARLTLVAFDDASADVTAGVLICDRPECREWFPISQGIPRLLVPALRRELTRQFVQEHGGRLAALGLSGSSSHSAPRDAELTARNIRNFGFEWNTYARFGWDDPEYDLAREQRVFHAKSQLTTQDLASGLVLDAGCGNGRYTHWAAAYGAQVIGVDVSNAVEPASRNTAALANVQIVQADLFRLPFSAETFDAIFSIGVLMHTGDAGRAFASLARTLRPTGTLSVHVYGKGNVFYEAIDPVLRAWTTRMSMARLQRFTARAFRLRGWLERARLINLLGKMVRLDTHPHCIFDWYSAPIATHHTYPEVHRWFADAGLIVNGTREQPQPRRSARVRQALAGGPTTVSLRGVKAPGAPPRVT